MKRRFIKKVKFPFFWGGGLWGMQDLSSQTRDRTCVSCMEAQSLNHLTTKEIPRIFFGKKVLVL